MNTPEYQEYDGPMLKRSLYEPDKTMAEERADFDKRYDAQVKNNARFNLKQELLKYCDADVELLAKAVFLN